MTRNAPAKPTTRRQRWTYATHLDLAVSARGVPSEYREAMLRILWNARAYYRRMLGASCVGSIELRTWVDPRSSLRLWTNGADRVYLQLASIDQLAPPSQGGPRWLHGLTHELAHIVLYRAVLNLPELPDGWGEGWAVYLASFWAVPHLARTLPHPLWPRHYDYLRWDGPSRYLADATDEPASAHENVVRRMRRLEQRLGRARFAATLRELLARRVPALRFPIELQRAARGRA